MRDIANETGLSITAVSLVLNDKPNKLAQATRHRILDAAEKLHYKPNQLAVGLAKKRTDTVGLILPDISNSFFATLALGVEEEAHKQGKNILLCNTGQDAERDVESMEVLAARGVDAIILCVSNHFGKNRMRMLEEKIRSIPLPVVMVDRREPTLFCSSVCLNNAKGADAAIEYLVGLGHRKFLIVTGPQNLSNNKERLEGCRSAMERHGLAMEDMPIFEGDFTHKGGIAAAAFAQDQDYTAAFLFNDMMAYGFCTALVGQGLRVPGDKSVVGFDDTFYSELFIPPLTTVRQPAYDLGCAAMGVALDEIDQAAKTKTMMAFEPELVVRGSAGPPPAKG